MLNKFRKFAEILHNPAAAFIVLIILLCITLLAYNILNNVVRKNAKERFDFRSKEIVGAIVDRMNIYESLLNGGAALFKASDFVSREEWKLFVETLDLDKQWPGVQAFGYSVPLEPEGIRSHLQQVRSEGFSDFNIKPPGNRDYYTSIIYIEPFDWRNKRAFGYDMWSNEIRREAMIRARDYGVSAASGVITLVQETEKDVQKGFLTYIPVYMKNMPINTVEERRNAFKGWVYGAFRINNLMKGILGTQDPSIAFEIYDGNEVLKDNLLFDSNNEHHLEMNNFNPEFDLIKTVEFQGRKWTIYINSAKGFIPPQDKRLPLYIALALLLIDLLLFYIFYSMNTLKMRATALANEMTAEVKKKVAELERSNKDLEQFAYVASHDLQEPVRKIVSFSQLFEKRYRGIVDDNGKKYIDFIIDGALRMRVLIQDLLKYSKVGQTDWKLQEVPLEDAVVEATENLSQAVSQSNAKIICNGLPTVSANKTYMVQLFQNLISNAIKYSNDDPVIEVSGESNSSKHIISVKDNGIGIKEEYLQSIFVIFERLHNTKDYEGTGIGLALCKRIIDQHGGEIWAESDGKNGTIFRFTLPA